MAKDWGQITWFLFHGMLEKISDDNFEQHKNTIKDFIVRTCILLPCPECQKHAIVYTKHLHKLNSRIEVRKFIFNFHNAVNERLKNPIFKEDELEKYKKINMAKVVHRFYVMYAYNKYHTRDFSQQMHRRTLANDIKQYFNNNIDLFT